MDHPSAENIIDLYEHHAAAWDNVRQHHFYEQKWLDKFRHAMIPHGKILDIGCGAGKPVAEYLIAQNHDLCGIDASPSMINRCRQRFPHHHWQVADMRQLALPDKFDGLLAWNSFFHLKRDDQRRMFAIFQCHARVNAILMFTSGPADGEAIGTFENQPLYHASLAPEEYRQLLHQHGFSVIDMQVEDPECGLQTIWLAKYDAINLS